MTTTLKKQQPNYLEQKRYFHHANSPLVSTVSHRYGGNNRMVTSKQYDFTRPVGDAPESPLARNHEEDSLAVCPPENMLSHGVNNRLFSIANGPGDSHACGCNAAMSTGTIACQ